MNKIIRASITLLIATLLLWGSPLQAKTTISKGFSVFSKLKYPDNFTHFDYVNPEAPKGGEITLGASGTFDSLNPFIVKGNSPLGIGLIFARLMDENHDRASECYPYVAESIELDDDHRFIIFHLNPKAKFSDGKSITVGDVIWSFETLKEKGLPMYRSYYKNVISVEKLSDHSVKFNLETAHHNPELPLILGQIYILPKHYYDKVGFNSTSLDPPPSSGPYTIEGLEQGHSITYKRVNNWWGENVPSQKGQYNFDRIKYDYYMESNTQFEGFKSGKIDFRQETSMKTWKTGYDFEAVKDGRVIREELPNGQNAHTAGFFFNIRRPLFQDIRVREAITLAFDFRWANEHLFYNGYKRKESYFANSCFAAVDLPDSLEKEVLDKHRINLPERLWTTPFKLPYPRNEKELRQILKHAIALLDEAGWHIVSGKLVNKKTKKPFVFDILISDKIHEKVCLLFAQNLKHLGITAHIQILDTTTFTQRSEHLNYDMIYQIIGQSNSLGNEQRDYFSSSRADLIGSRNYAGVKDPIVDDIIEELIQSSSYKMLCSRGKALDRVLLWNFYMIPSWYSDMDKIAYWNKFSRPKITAKFLPANILTWWIDPHKLAKLEKETSQVDETAPAMNHKDKSLWQRIREIF